MINILLLQSLISFQQKFFDARFKQSDLVTKTDFDDKLKISKKLPQIKQSTYLLKMN